MEPQYLTQQSRLYTQNPRDRLAQHTIVSRLAAAVLLNRMPLQCALRDNARQIGCLSRCACEITYEGQCYIRLMVRAGGGNMPCSRHISCGVFSCLFTLVSEHLKRIEGIAIDAVCQAHMAIHSPL